MSWVDAIQIAGLSLNMVGVALLGLFAVPAHDLSPEGTEPLEVKVSNEEQRRRANTYKMYRRITLGAYFVIFLGFLIQVVSYFI